MCIRDSISRTVLGKGLDAGTAFEILSIDIADVDVGRNIGAQLQTDQAAVSYTHLDVYKRQSQHSLTHYKCGLVAVCRKRSLI